MNLLITLAQAQQAPPQSPLFFPGMMVLMVGIFYFLVIRPQSRRDKERRAMLNEVKTGDRIVFAGGILGQITNDKEKTLMVKIADNVKVEITRGAITNVLKKGEKPEE